MSTRLDERSATELRDLLERPPLPQELVRIGTTTPTPRPVPPGALGPAMLAWMAMVFGLCYLALPAAGAIFGLYDGLLAGVLFNLPAFVLATFVAVVVATAARPRVHTDVRQARDPVLSAATGGLLTWGLLHNTAPFLRHFPEFGGGELLAFVGVNVVEMTLIGMMLSSFTRHRTVAFGLGALFQLLVFGLLSALLAI